MPARDRPPEWPGSQGSRGLGWCLSREEAPFPAGLAGLSWTEPWQRLLGRRRSSQMSYHCCSLVSCHQDFLLCCCLSSVHFSGQGGWQGCNSMACCPPLTPLPTPPAHCCWALHLRDKGSKQAVQEGVSSSRWNMSCSATLDNGEQSAEAWRKQWEAVEARMSDWGMPVYAAEYGWLPEPILLGKQPFPHSELPLPFPPPYAPPLATSKTSSDIFGCSVQILLVRAVKETDLSAC